MKQPSDNVRFFNGHVEGIANGYIVTIYYSDDEDAKVRVFRDTAERAANAVAMAVVPLAVEVCQFKEGEKK